MIVLDSSFLIAYHNWRDAHHDAAVPIMHALKEKVWGQTLLLEYVFLEVVTVVLGRRNLAAASRVVSTLLGARELNFVPCSDFLLETVETFCGQGTSKISFADAAVVTVARQHNAPGATSDQGFLALDQVDVIPESAL